MADRKARYERRQRAAERRAQDSRRARRGNLMRNLLIVAGGVAVVALVVGGVFQLVSNVKELPPTGAPPGHAETLPQRQINARPIPRPVQQHVMERNSSHPDGSMLVQYNCSDYQCEPDLVEKLTAIVQSYRSTVYMAPYPGMDALIALAAPGRLLILESLDEDRVRQFIEENLSR